MGERERREGKELQSRCNFFFLRLSSLHFLFCLLSFFLFSYKFFFVFLTCLQQAWRCVSLPRRLSVSLTHSFLSLLLLSHDCFHVSVMLLHFNAHLLGFFFPTETKRRWKSEWERKRGRERRGKEGKSRNLLPLWQSFCCPEVEAEIFDNRSLFCWLCSFLLILLSLSSSLFPLLIVYAGRHWMKDTFFVFCEKERKERLTSNQTALTTTHDDLKERKEKTKKEEIGKEEEEEEWKLMWDILSGEVVWESLDRDSGDSEVHATAKQNNCESICFRIEKKEKKH